MFILLVVFISVCLIALCGIIIWLVSHRNKNATKHCRIDRWVWNHSTTPPFYIDVDNPPVTRKEKKARPQEARQDMFNRWCRFHKHYSGSYLPKNDYLLLKQGWINTTHPKYWIGRQYHCLSTGQNVIHDYNYFTNSPEQEQYGMHYHWLNCYEMNIKGYKKQKYPYIDRHGIPCYDDQTPTSPHHIGEEGKPYVPYKKNKQQGRH